MKPSAVLALALAAVVFAPPVSRGQNSLGITESNSQSVLYWSNPGSGTNAILMGANSLVPFSWTAATDAVPVNYGSKTALSVSNSSPARLFRLSLVPPTSDGMALIPARTYLIGDVADTNFNGDATPTNVYVSAFYVDTNLVTYGQWQNVYSFAISHGYSFTNAGSAKATNQLMQPVESLDWYDAVKWCNARSQKAGLNPVYFTDPGFSQVYTNGETNGMNGVTITVYANWQANGYRLPTEAEWEKAARGGLKGLRFPWGQTVSESQANYLGKDPLFTPPLFYDLGPNGYNSLGYDTFSPFTTPGGTFPANGYGLNDMAGNLEEWCWDWYDDTLTDAGSPYAGGTDPRGTASSPYAARVWRSGAWDAPAINLRCANRGAGSPNSAGANAGFRCVRKY